MYQEIWGHIREQPEDGNFDLMVEHFRLLQESKLPQKVFDNNDKIYNPLYSCLNYYYIFHLKGIYKDWIMDELSSLVAKFIKEQPLEIRKKYVAYLEVRNNETSDTLKKLYSTEFSFEDMRILTSGITQLLLDKVKIGDIIVKVNSK